MAHLTESQHMRKLATLLEKDILTDANGLRLSNTTDSGYALVSMLSSGPLAGKFIPYANIFGEELQAEKKAFERSQGGALVPGFFQHKNVIGLTVEDDVRDAAYIAQKFSDDLELNLMELFDGNTTIIPKPPESWEHAPDESALERMKKAGERKPRKVKPRGPKIKDAQGALFKVWGENKDLYVAIPPKDMPILRKEVENKAREMGWVDAASEALEKYKKMRANEFILEYKIEDEDTFKIPAENWGYLQGRIDDLNKKGSKIGAPPITINVVRKETEKGKSKTGEETQKQFYIVTVHGEAPKIDGWRLIASLDYESGGVVARVVPGEDMPSEFRNTDPSRCDHCNVHRGRNNSYIIQHDSGEVKQVGRTCLKNFLGHTNPKFITSMAEIVRSLDELMDESREERDYGGKAPDQHDLEAYLGYVTALIRSDGWVPKSKSFEGGPPPTAYEAFSNMYPKSKYDRENKVEPTSADVEVAQNAIKWVREELPKKKDSRRGLSDYEHNLIVLTADDMFKSKHAGFVASVIAAYQRWKDNEVKYAEKKRQATKSAGESEYQGDVGVRFGAKNINPLELKFMSVRWFDGHYGTTGIHKFVDNDGNYFVWFASTDPELEQEHWYTFAATVKKHEPDKYNNGAKTTYLTRMKKLSDLGTKD